MAETSGLLNRQSSNIGSKVRILPSPQGSLTGRIPIKNETYFYKGFYKNPQIVFGGLRLAFRRYFASPLFAGKDLKNLFLKSFNFLCI